MYYGMSETIRHGLFLIYTKLFWPRARMVRMPIYARTRRNISYGNGLTIGYGCKIAAVKDSSIVFGENVTLGDYVQIQSSNEIVIGDNVLFASRIYVGDSNHGFYSGNDQSYPDIPPNDRPLNKGRVIIGNNVWIGNGVTIVGNVNIGDGAVIGANSVVIKDVEPQSIYAGAPARKRKQWNQESKQWESV